MSLFLLVSLPGVQPGVEEDGVPPLQEPVPWWHRVALPRLPAHLPGQHLRLAHLVRAQAPARRVPRHQHAALLPVAHLPDRWHAGTGRRRGCCWGRSRRRSWRTAGLHPLSGGGAGPDGVAAARGDDGGAAALRLHAAQAEPAAGVRRRPVRSVPEERAAAARQPHRSVNTTQTNFVDSAETNGLSLSKHISADSLLNCCHLS